MNNWIYQQSYQKLGFFVQIGVPSFKVLHEEAIQDKNSSKKRKLYCTMILMRKVWWMKIVSLEKHATHMR